MVQRSRPCWMRMTCFGSNSGTTTLLRSQSKYEQPEGRRFCCCLPVSSPNLILSHNRQIPKMVKEISASKKQPDGKVQCSGFFYMCFLISWTMNFIPVMYSLSKHLISFFKFQITISNLAQMMKKMPSFRKQLTEVWSIIELLVCWCL